MGAHFAHDRADLPVVAALADRRRSSDTALIGTALNRTALNRTVLSDAEAHRLDEALRGAIASSAALPTLKHLAAAVGVPRHRLRRAIGSVDNAVDSLVDERLAAARRCGAMTCRWYPSLTEMSEDLVTHRLFVYRIVSGVVPDAMRRLSTAAQLAELSAALDADLAYQIRRLRLLDDDAAISEFVADVGGLFAFERLHLLDRGDDRALARRLTSELGVDMGRYRLFQRWCDQRHDWFGIEPDAAAAS